MLKIKLDKPAKGKVEMAKLPVGDVEVDTLAGFAIIKDANGTIIGKYKVTDFNFTPVAHTHELKTSSLDPAEPCTETPKTDHPVDEYLTNLKKKADLKDKRIVDSIREGTAVLSEKQSKCKYCLVGNMEWVKYKDHEGAFRWALVEADGQGSLRAHRCPTMKKAALEKLMKK